MAAALKGADVLISLSQPGPDVIKPDWVRTMAPNAIVFGTGRISMKQMLKAGLQVDLAAVLVITLVTTVVL